MRVAGIDPGISGAIALLPDVLICDTPVAKEVKRSAYLAANMALILERWRPEAVVIEQQVPYSPPGRKVGASSMFGLGYGYGLWQGIAAALGLPIYFLAPRVWKDYCGLLGKDKDASRLRAMQLYPASAELLTRKKDHGRADALLIAHTWYEERRDRAG